jgi:hypothetical protein
MYYLPPDAKEVKKKLVAIMSEADTSGKISPADYIKLMDEVIKECQTRSWVTRIKLKNR